METSKSNNMRKAAILFFTFLLLIVTMTFGGMVLFGMGSGMAGAPPCDASGCAPADGNAPCINYCLQNISPPPALPLTIIAAAAWIMLVAAIFSRREEKGACSGFFHRARDAFQKLFLKRYLSLVILRN